MLLSADGFCVGFFRFSDAKLGSFFELTKLFTTFFDGVFLMVFRMGD